MWVDSEIAAKLGLGAAQAQLAGVAPNTAAAIARSHKAAIPKSKKRQAEPVEPQEGIRKSARGGPSYNEEQAMAQKAVSINIQSLPTDPKPRNRVALDDADFTL